MRSAIIRLGRWVYVKLLPYPRLRAILSKINNRLRVCKNIKLITTVNPPPKLQEGVSKECTINNISQINVAMIVDEFSFNSFRYECNAFPLNPEGWKKTFKENKIDIFFCESAWAGVDPIKRPWRGKIYASENFSRENRRILLRIIKYCKRKKIPTVFWNKEDPAHYEDRVHDFVKTSLEFDHIFTTAEECVQRYKDDHNHKSVYLLMFGTQPRLFNPMEKFNRTEEIVFAGSWYKQHPSRVEEMTRIFDAILEGELPLKIYNRQSKNDDANHEFPSKYLPFVYPSLSHNYLDIAYKGSKYGLNINTVKNSETMFSRRVFELMSSNTLVLSNYSKGMESLFGENVVFLDGSLPPDLNNEAKKREYCLYEVLKNHTYRMRFRQILDDIGLAYWDEQPMVTILYNVSNWEDAENSVKHFHSIDWESKKCMLIIDEKCEVGVLQELTFGYNNGCISVCSEHYNNEYRNDGKMSFVESGYILKPTFDLRNDFIKKAFLHICYLPKGVGIIEDKEKYKLIERRQGSNMLIPRDRMHNETLKLYTV